MPVPQENSLLRSCNIVSNSQDACSTRKFTLCGTGILPVHKRGTGILPVHKRFVTSWEYCTKNCVVRSRL
ncbi:MAG: hypothetical protein QQW96_23370 [Tychonema bourrellyi B0820]|nr:hypothetical protein [Tychonema bourrellyi B0820]